MDLPDAQRAEWLEGLAGADATVKPWLARVLGVGGTMPTGNAWEPLQPAPDAFAPGVLVGPYRLESRLGEGGMGEVWRASRSDEGPRREVALKLPHPELLGAPFRQRFARERDVLAALSHPHIAQLYDAGLSADGHPYLALELVEGQPINEACATENASLNRRIDLVRQVLEALTYAHQRLIVHRDIKPTNVLVTPKGGVKLLDFGIAKLLHPTDPQNPRLTQGAARLATPAYAAPEQFDDGEITVATDIFSVGVLLFELCTGQRPYGARPGRDGPDAPLASHRANEAACGMHPDARLARALHGDLDAIIAHALALDPGARYSSAEAFARDLARWRNGLPVSARRVGWAALSLKFARRNKVGVALAAVLALALFAGTAGIAWQARLTAAAAARAEHEAARANAVKDYLISIFEHGDPHGGGKAVETMTAKELLDAGADRADAAFAGQPETEIELLETLGGIYNALEDPSHSGQLGARRLQLVRTLYGTDDPRVLDATMDVAEDRVFFLDSAGARTLLQSIRAPVFSRFGAQSREWARWLQDSANSLRSIHGARDEGLSESRQAAAIYQAHFPHDENYPDALFCLSGYQLDAEQYPEALATLQQMQKVSQSRGNGDAMDDLAYMIQAGNVLRRLGRYVEAEKLLRQSQALAEKLLGRQAGFYLASLVNIALIENDQGDRANAMSLFAQGMAIAVGKAASTGFLTNMHRQYGGALADDGDAAAAIPLLEDALRQTTLHPKDETNLRITQGYLGDAYDKAGRTEEARALLQTARNDWVRYGAPTGALALGARERWARFLLDHAAPDAARAECTEILRLAAGAASAPAALAQSDLARLALLQNDTIDADHFSAQAVQTIEAVKQGYDIRARTDVWLTRAETLLAANQKPQAAALATRALTAAQTSEAPPSPRLARALAIARRTQ
jgi:eukaryotic-like serine/threonine-protein kinase